MGNLSVDKLESPGQCSVVSVYLRRPYHRVCISAKGSQAQKPNVVHNLRVEQTHVPPDERLARRSVGNATCTPSNGRTKLEGTRT